jgi:hypothetical protein
MLSLPTRRRSIRPGITALALLAALTAGCDVLHLAVLAPRGTGKNLPATPGLPSHHSLRVSQFVFVSDFEVQADQPLFRELSALREQVLTELQLPAPPSSALVRVYLFEDRDRYERFMQARYPSLPRRRAFFVAQPRGMGAAEDLLVYTFWGDHIRQDLRHELTHAILHSVLKDVPLWLDEGLAEYFELAPEMKGINRQHLLLMQRDGLKPDLARLEQLSQVEQMNPVEYREAWAWTHFMLRGDPRTRPVLLAYMQQLRKSAAPGPMLPILQNQIPDLNAALLQHLSQL